MKLSEVLRQTGTVPGRHFAVCELGDVRRAGDGQFIKTVCAMHDPGPLRSQVPEHLCHWFNPLTREGSDEQSFDRRGVRQGPQNIEYRAHTHLDARRTDVTHGTVVGGSQKKADSSFPDRPFNRRNVRVQVYAQFGEYICGTGFRRRGTISMFCDWYAAARHDDRRSR